MSRPVTGPIFAAALLIGLAIPGAAQERRQVLLDLVTLAPGATLADRTAYNSDARPVAGRHGIVLVQSLDIMRHLAGGVDFHRLDIWTIPDPSAVDRWGVDPAFVALSPRIRQVHDIETLAGLTGLEIAPVTLEPGEHYLAMLRAAKDPATFYDGLTGYLDAWERAARPLGITVEAIFVNLRPAFGPESRTGLDAAILWHLPEPGSLPALMASPDWDAVLGIEPDLFATGAATVAIARARAIPDG